ncbi:MAG TPA: PAS domain S-box protein [Pirellulales bacterium]|nr:PAS domain S-box protein [Pirellulales bacterium]
MDDIPANLVVLRAILESSDYDLVEARSGEEALEQLKGREFACILLDVRMPGLSGFETARLIRADGRSRHTPILFLTADDPDRTQIENGYALGAVDFFVKPLVPIIVQTKVRGFVDLFNEKQRARHEADQLRLLVQSTRDYAIFMLDPNGRVVSWNAGAERIKGYKADEIIGQHFSRFYPQEALDRGWPAHELQVATAEGRFEDEGWRVRKDGSQFWANVVITALRDEHGNLRGFSKVTRDLTERKKVEESLRRSEEQLRLLVQGTKDYAIFLLDPQGNIASWNNGAERIKGYKADEIIGQHFSRFYPQEALDRGWPAHELQVAAAEGRFEDEGWRVRKDGSQFWANVVITALRDEHGNLRGFSKITRDMSERKNAEENARLLVEESTARRVAEENAQLIQEQRERLQVTLTSIGDAVISTDDEGRVEFLNRVAEELVGWTSDEAVGHSLTEVFCIVNEKTRQPVDNPAVRALREGKIVGLANHTVLISKDGTERPIDDSAAPIRDTEGNVIGSVLVFRDISERKRSEVVQTGQKHVLELLVEGAPLPDVLDRLCEIMESQSQDKLITTILLVDEDGHRLRSVAGRRAPADYARAVDGIRIGPGVGSCGTAAYRGEPVIVSDIATDPLWADFRDLALSHGLQACWSTPIFSSQDRVLGTFAVYYDTPHRPSSEEVRLVDILTRTAGVAVERRQAEAALREADHRKDEFLATLAHELRNPLAPMRNALQVIQLAGNDTKAVGQAREMMERQMRHMVRLVDDLLDVSRITRGKLELRKQRVDLLAVVRTAVETSRPLIEAASHHLTITMPQQPLFVDGDPVRLAQVFSNLLNNAAKYTEQGGEIWLTAERQGSDAVLSVRDTGLGIPKEMLAKVFELFTQVDRTLEKSQGGLGIGLTLVRRLIEMHGGSIEARSEGYGKGSEFIVRLPAVLTGAPSEDKTADKSTPSSHRRILVVDDNRDSAISLGMMLQLMGNEVRTAHDGLDAVRTAEVFGPDVVLMDIGLPKLNGYEAARRIREEAWGRDMLLIAVTGWGQEDDKRRSKEAGFNFHLVKPVELAALEKLLSGLLSR